MIGIRLAVGIVVTTLSFFDVIDVMKNLQFRAISREDVTVTFEGPRASRTDASLARLPGVLTAEPFRAVPVRAGDSVVVDVLEGTRPRLVVEVAGVVDDLFGAMAYMEINALYGDGLRLRDCLWCRL